MIKERNIWISIILSLVTCGLYEIYWVACISNDIDTITNNEQPRNAVLVIILSIVTFGIYLVYWSYQNGKMLSEYGVKNNIKVNSNEALSIVLALICFIANVIIAQVDLNNIAKSSY